MSVFLRDTPIKRKLMLVILLASGFALFLMGSALITYELMTFRRSLAVNIGVLAEIIGSNSTASLAFRDAKSANEILSALSAEHQITAAAIYNNEGQIFARFPANAPLGNFSQTPHADGDRFHKSHLEMFRPIMLEKRRIGTIYLEADLGAMYYRVAVYGALLLVVTACAAGGAISLTTTLQKRISQPILELAKVATAVSERQDYSVRGTKHGSDEIGQLTDAFNQMLTRIGESNTALMASEERLRLALEGSQTGTWDWNLPTGRVTWDDYMYPLFHRKKEEFEGTWESFMKFVHPHDRAKLARETREALECGDSIDIDFRIVDPDGTVRHMASRGRAFYDANGKAVRMTGVSLDVTASKRYEEELNRAKEQAEAANEAKDNFLAVLSHELRTPLTPVLTTVAMLEEDSTIGAHISRELEMIRRNIEVEARLIDDLLDVTGIIRGKLELHRQLVDIRPLLEHAMKNYCAGEADKKNLRVSMEITASETHALADASRITQVFWNLLQNACKFTPEGGAIRIRAYNDFSPEIGTEPGHDGAESGTELVVEIKDTGIGISPENMPRIFNAFEQGERSRTRVFGGLGLGLAISRAIVEMHGGSIAAESAGTEKGSTITVRLRTVPTPTSKPGTRQKPSPRRHDEPALRSLRVLLVEDHRDTAEQLTRLLTRVGHEVTWAATISKARELIAAHTKQPGHEFNILISDLGLPDGSGHDLMRDLASNHPIPGIALSGYGMKDDIQDSMAAGFSRHITKPVDWQELKTAIQRIAVSDGSAGS
jgi:PAS domain S-box-containing protein